MARRATSLGPKPSLFFFVFFVFFSFPFFASNRKTCFPPRKGNFLFHQSFLFFLVSCRFFFRNPFSYLCFFLILSYVFVQHQCFWFQKAQVENTNFGSKGGLQQNVFFYEPVFCKMWKAIIFCHIFGKFWLYFKKHYKIGISAHFKSKKNKKNTIFQSY